MPIRMTQIYGGRLTDLLGRPGLAALSGVARCARIDDLAIEEGFLQPVLLQPVLLDFVEGKTATFAKHRAEDVVLVGPLDPVEFPVLLRTFDTASDGLVDDDLLDAILGEVIHVEVQRSD